MTPTTRLAEGDKVTITLRLPADLVADLRAAAARHAQEARQWPD